ncbi:MAG: hypothetical protein M3347_08165 [Armatimonadota bacterium]|nr:hypothetical protein [Armatimonadota bacterium]
MSLSAGADWSGTPDKPMGAIDLFSFCVVAFENSDAVNEACHVTRPALGMAADEEFHGHDMSDAMNAAVLEMGMHLNLQIGILFVNKAAAPLEGRIILPPPAVFTAQIALRLLERFLPICPLRDLWCDEDLKGQAAQEFVTAVRRLSRAHHPQSKLKTRLRDSRKSNLVQIADVANYTLTRQARGGKSEPVLENVLRKIRGDDRNLILGPMPWEPEEE